MSGRTQPHSVLGNLAAVLLGLGMLFAQNAIAEVDSIEPEALAARIESGDAPLILDVRSTKEFAAGHLPGAVNIPHDELRTRLDELGAAPDAEVVVYCHSGRRAGWAETVLVESGYTKVLDLDGHWQQWSDDKIRGDAPPPPQH